MEKCFKKTIYVFNCDEDGQIYFDLKDMMDDGIEDGDKIAIYELKAVKTLKSKPELV